MSTQSNQYSKYWKDVWAKLRRNTYMLDKFQAHEEDQFAIADGYFLMICVMSDACGTLPDKWVQQMTYIVTHESVLDVVRHLAALDDMLLAIIQDDAMDACLECFKRIHQQYPHKGKWTWLVSTMYTKCTQCTDDPIHCFKGLHQSFSFISRLTLRHREDLEAEAMADYLVHEDEMCDTYPLIGLPLNKIIKRWFPNTIRTYSMLYGDWVPKHGNGSVAEGNLSLSGKYHALMRDRDTDYLDLLTGGIGYPRSLPYGLDRTAKVVFVPKNAQKLRTICMEPATLQFLQHAGMRNIIRYFNHSYLGRRIDLAHPEINREMARIGSFDGDYSTIDLSAASDSVSWALVRSAFDGTPLLPLFECTRSKRATLPNGEVVALRKFAPMGSALCFPVECIIFSAIVEWAIRQAHGSPEHSHYCVYGDDIVVETEYASSVIEALEEFGFKVNTEKSYYSLTRLNYRESCGGEFVLGEDVTPVKISRKFHGLDRPSLMGDVSHYEGAIELANNLYDCSPTARLMIIQTLNDLPQWARPLFVGLDEDGGIKSTTPTNWRLAKREASYIIPWPHNWYQKDQYRHGCRKNPIGIIDAEDEDIRLYECLRSMAEAPDRDLQEVSSEPFRPLTPLQPRFKGDDREFLTAGVLIDHEGTPHQARRLTSRWSV